MKKDDFKSHFYCLKEENAITWFLNVTFLSLLMANIKSPAQPGHHLTFLHFYFLLKYLDKYASKNAFKIQGGNI